MPALQTTAFIRQDNRRYAKTRGVSPNCSALGFLPAFKDAVTGEICLSRFADGATAPVHIPDGMPDHWVVERDEHHHVTRIKGSIMAGFVRNGRFFSREDLANPRCDA